MELGTVGAGGVERSQEVWAVPGRWGEATLGPGGKCTGEASPGKRAAGRAKGSGEMGSKPERRGGGESGREPQSDTERWK